MFNTADYLHFATVVIISYTNFPPPIPSPSTCSGVYLQTRNNRHVSPWERTEGGDVTLEVEDLGTVVTTQDRLSSVQTDGAPVLIRVVLLRVKAPCNNARCSTLRYFTLSYLFTFVTIKLATSFNLDNLLDIHTWVHSHELYLNPLN